MRKLRSKVGIFLLAALTAFVVLLFGGRREDPNENARAERSARFKAELLKTISESDRIDVVEHSWRFDFPDDEWGFASDPPNIEYRRISLSADQRQELRRAFEAMPDAPKTEITFCAFYPHHRLELQTKDGGRTAILVCFKCQDTEWYAAPADKPGEFRQIPGGPPDEFEKTFLRFIEGLGCEAYRDWHALAESRAGKIVPPDPLACPVFDIAEPSSAAEEQSEPISD